MQTKNMDTKFAPLIRQAIDGLYESKNFPLFTHIEIETLNRCNGACSFCGVNKNADPRSKQTMSEELYLSILEQLADLKYDRSISLYSNNEPLLDKRIYAFAEIARAKLPQARILLFTNGTILTLENFKRLIPNLDVLIIDNYSDDLVLHEHLEEVLEYWKANRDDNKEVRFLIRKENDILDSRGGTAPNKTIDTPPTSSCMLPFCQVVVRPDGKLSLCCNDALGANTLGDLNKESLSDIWYGDTYESFRQKIRQGRSNIDTCARCDSFSGYFIFKTTGVARKAQIKLNAGCKKV